ncbi:MAG: fimbria/pilus outer membrane usher protein [Leptolyngbya sp. BL-A-14]
MFPVPAPLHSGQAPSPPAILSGAPSDHAPASRLPPQAISRSSSIPLAASPQKVTRPEASAQTVPKPAAPSQPERFPPETSTPALGVTKPTAQSQPETVPPGTPTEDELFEQVFKRPRVLKGTQRLPIPFSINGEEQGQLFVLLTPGGTPAVRLQAAPFLQKIATLVRPDIQSKLQAAVDSEGNLSLEVLRESGLGAIFDDRRLELQIQVPPAQRATNLVGGQLGNLPPEAKEALPPSPVSGYLNLRGGQDFVWSGRSTQLGRQPLQLDFEGAINIKGWVLEGFANFSENGQPAWRRGDLRLVRDDPAKAIRYLVGDLAIPVTGYQTSRPMFGMTVARNFSLQPYLVTRPISEFQFFLAQPSRVEVYSNGQQVQTLQLPAGPQDIRNLPLATGFNNVQLIITDPVGRVQRLDFSTSVADSLLAPGFQQFAYSLGFPTAVERNGYAYDWGKPVLTLSHRWGVNETLTLGGYFQGSLQQQLAGIEGVWATPLGNVGWDAAVSHANQAGNDYAMRLRYDYVQSGAGNPQQRRFGLAAEYRGAQFTTLSALEPHNSTSWDLSAYYSQKLFWGMNGRLNVRYQVGRDTSSAYQVSIGLSKAFANGLGVNLTLSQTLNVTGQDETRAFVNLSWLLPGQRQSLQASTDVRNTQRPVSNLTWNYSSPQTVEGINASVGFSSDGDTYGFKGDLAYTGYRANVELVQDGLFARTQNGESVNATRLTFGTAIVFAGGRFGWSRPVMGSFAIVTRNPALKGRTVGITPGSGNYVARADALGPAVVLNLQPYRVSTLQLEAPELPLGYDLGRDRYYLLPTYKSGTLIQVGSDPTVFVRGTLLNPNGQPIALQAGEVRSLSNAAWPSVNLFTNRVGRFALSGLQPGRYELRLYANSKAVIPFELPAGKTGVVDLGQLQAPVPVL